MELKFKNIRFQLLLAGLFLFLILAPFLKQFTFAYIFIDLLLSYVLLSAIFTLQKNRAVKGVSIMLLLSALTLIWLNLLGILKFSLIFTYTLLSLYLAVIICSMFIRFFSAKKFDASVIYAALCLYLIVGVFWGTVYALLDTAMPGSFQGTILEVSSSPELRLHGFIYFSFTTLTTLGYGDIVPLTLQAAALCQTEAIMGLFFISVIIAQIVGIRVAERMKKDQEV